MSAEARSRVLLGIGIPLGAFLFLGLLILAFSRILLAVPESLAPWVALLFATNILVGCALAAMIRGTRGFAFLITVLVATIAIGGIAGLVVGERPVHSLVEGEEHVTAAEGGENQPSHAEEPVAATEEEAPGEGVEEEAVAEGGGGGAGGAEPVSIAAEALQFSTSQLSLASGAEAVIAFDNREAQPHNVSIYTAPGGEALFQGEIITGPAQIEYRIPAPQPGEYHFQCDVHPTTMTGTVTVA